MIWGNEYDEDEESLEITMSHGVEQVMLNVFVRI